MRTWRNFQENERVIIFAPVDFCSIHNWSFNIKKNFKPGLMLKRNLCHRKVEKGSCSSLYSRQCVMRKSNESLEETHTKCSPFCASTVNREPFSLTSFMKRYKVQILKVQFFFSINFCEFICPSPFDLCDQTWRIYYLTMLISTYSIYIDAASLHYNISCHTTHVISL